MLAFRQPLGDLELVNGDIGLIGGAEYARQKISNRLRFFLGEWFLDARQGFPWFRDVLVKGPNLEVARSDYRQTILSVPGITAVRKLELSIDTVQRRLSVDFECLYQEGAATPVVIADSVNFIIQSR